MASVIVDSVPLFPKRENLKIWCKILLKYSSRSNSQNKSSSSTLQQCVRNSKFLEFNTIRPKSNLSTLQCSFATADKTLGFPTSHKCGLHAAKPQHLFSDWLKNLEQRNRKSLSCSLLFSFKAKDLIHTHTLKYLNFFTVVTKLRLRHVA
jgi:hypothetical protein